MPPTQLPLLMLLQTPATSFLNCFCSKISGIRQIIIAPMDPPCVYPPSRPTSSFTLFNPVSLSSLLQMNASFCPLDILSPHFLKQVFTTICPFIPNILNSYLSSGTVPRYFKDALVHPFLKKPGLNSTDFNHFRHISKLPILAKVLEKIVANQLLAFMNQNSLFESFQSALDLTIAQKPFCSK